jgi:NAD(P) transhydrogenase
METHRYELVVLGSGPAGEKGAAQAAYFGKRVALVEKDDQLGGAAAGTTVSSKTLRETSLILSGIKARKLSGVDLSLKHHATVQDFLFHERAVKDLERSRVAENLVRHQIDRYQGLGSFVNAHTVKVEHEGHPDVQLQGDVILVATGSSPRRPDLFPEAARIYDSDSILELNEIPRTMAVIGGGVIGCEYACIFAVLGVQVQLIHPGDRLLTFLDDEISAGLQQSMLNAGIHLHLEKQVQSCSPEPEGVRLQLASGETLHIDAVMLATGRSSNTSRLNLEAAGIMTGKYGVLVVDDTYQVVHPQTHAPVAGVYAAGDVIGAPALASTSMEQARYAMIKAFNLLPYKDQVAPILPVGIYTIPECSAAGLTEAQCQEQGKEYVVGKTYYLQNARGMIIGDEEGFLKLIFEYNDDLNQPLKLLGVHVLGEIASELVHLGLQALMMEASSDLFINTCYNYPTLGELYKYATYAALGDREHRLTHARKADPVSWRRGSDPQGLMNESRLV